MQRFFGTNRVLQWEPGMIICNIILLTMSIRENVILVVVGVKISNFITAFELLFSISLVELDGLSEMILKVKWFDF